MSYNDSYGHEPRRPARRATREPSGPAKVQGSTAAAILILVGIIGFGIGALIGNASGGGSAGTATGDQDAVVGSPDDDQGAGPDSTEPTDGSTQSPAVGITLEMDDEADADEELDYEVRTDPPQPGLVLGVERRAPGGEWQPFGDPHQVQAELDDDGEDDGYVITGIAGETEWRVVGDIDGQRVESNVVTTTITEDDDNDGDNSGRGNGNGNDNGGDDD